MLAAARVVPALAVLAALAACGSSSETPEGDPEPLACSADELVEDGTCIPEACGVGDWGNLAPTDADFAVHPAGSRDGDGSVTDPFDRIEDAADAAGEAGGGRVVVAAGTYERTVSLNALNDGVVIEGRCPELVVVTARDEGEPSVTIPTGSVELRSLTVRGGTPALEVGRFGGTAPVNVRLHDVVVSEGAGFGILAFSAQVLIEMTDSVVRSTQRDAAGEWGYGIVLGDGPTLIGSGLLIEDSYGAGIAVDRPPSHLDLSDSTIRGTRPFGGELDFARGIAIQFGASMVGRDLRFEGAAQVGLMVSQAGSTAEITDSWFSSTPDLRLPNGRGGRGLDVGDGAHFVGERLVFEDCAELAVFAWGEDTLLEVSDVEVRGTTPDGDGQMGRAFNIQWGADLFATDMLLEDNRAAGVMSFGEGAHVELADVLIRDNGDDVSGGGGKGVVAQAWGELVATDLVVEGGTGPGALVSGLGDLTCTDCFFDGNAFAGVVAGWGSTTLIGGGVSGTTRSVSFGGGVGLFAEDTFGPAHVDVTGTTFEDLRGPALYLVGGSGGYSFDGVTVHETGAEASTAAGLVALGGIEQWDAEAGTGLLVADSTFEGLGVDAVLLDASAITLDGTSFDDVDGFDVYQQHCEDGAGIELVSGDVSDNGCEGWTRETEPHLLYRVAVTEAEVTR